MSDRKPASSPLRFLTPGQLAICLLLFFLPWVELQCPMPKGGMNAAMGVGPGEPKMDSKDVVWTGFINQSGLEAATGKFSFSDSIMQQAVQGQKKDAKADEKLDAAPLLWVYLLVVLAGVGLGFALPAGGMRKAALVGCCGVALLVAGVQAASGFPIEKKMKDDAKNKGGTKGDDIGAAMFGEMTPKVKYKFPFYLSMLLCVGGLVTALMEPAGPAKPRRNRSEGGDTYVAGGGDFGDGGDGGGGGGDGGGD